MAARSAGGVSPVRTATDRSGAAQPEAGRLVGDAGQRELEVLVHVGGQGPQRRDVDDPGRRRRRGVDARLGLGPVGGVDGHQEAGQGLAGAGRRGHQDVAPRRDVGPGPACGSVGPAGKRRANQLGHRRVERQWRRQEIGHLPI